MERLKAEARGSDSPRTRFTFQYGEIKRHGIKVSVREQKTFTFQYGEIKRCGIGMHPNRQAAFTFQYGEIKSNRQDIVTEQEIEIYIPVWRD